MQRARPPAHRAAGAALLIGAALLALLALMRMPAGDVFASPARYYEPAPALSPAPSFDLSLTPLGAGRLRLDLSLTNIALTAICSSEPVPVLEGHAHVFIDGRKRGSLFEPSAVIEGLAPGPHTVTVSISRPPHHRVMTVNGAPLSISRTVNIPPAGPRSH